MYSEQEKKYYIKQEQDAAKGNIKIVKKDFYDNLPRAVCEVLDSISWRWIKHDWFEEAWNKYREHVINASAGGLAIKAPGFVFNDYIDEQVKQDFLNRENVEILHSDADLAELYHSGIKGQKWGVRRYQNEDGTLTDAGKARYNKEGEKYADPKKMSDKELSEANKRLAAEQQYKQLTGTTQPGRAINRDTAIKIGATFVSTAAATFLLRKYKSGTFLGGPRIKSGGFGSGQARKTRIKKAVGAATVTALLAGSIGALMAGAGSLGGTARPESKKED